VSSSVPSAGRPSMADVARLANVSTQTVSRYFTGVGYVREDTRDRIASAVGQLGYRRNQSARNFRRQRMDTVGVLAMGPLNYGTAEILTGLSLAARREAMTLTIMQLDLGLDAEDQLVEVRGALDHLLSLPADGIAVLTPFAGVEQVLGEITGSTPMITISDHASANGPVASAHSRAAAHQATQHLLDLGHEQIIHIAGPPGRNEASERERGYREVMNAAGLPSTVVGGADDWTSPSGFRAAKSVDLDFTGVVAANDEIALGFMSGMTRRGRHAPHHYSIVGIDDMPSSAFFSPPLTTVRLDFRTLGAIALEELLRQVRTASPAVHCGTEPELVIRESTADRRAAGTRP
jgi:DNA-binding LacI/PurR family transcriptional regulator